MSPSSAGRTGRAERSMPPGGRRHTAQQQAALGTRFGTGRAGRGSAQRLVILHLTRTPLSRRHAPLVPSGFGEFVTSRGCTVTAPC